MSTVTGGTAQVLKYLHPARLGPYMQRCGGDDYSALALHTWNTHMAAALHESLSPVEIILRNALDEHIATWNERQTPPPGEAPYTRSWLINPAAPLSTIVTAQKRADLRFYAKRSKDKRAPHHPRKRAPIEHNDLLSQTNFGLWNDLLPHK